MSDQVAGLAVLDEARRDPGVFAEILLGAPLWPHQLDVVASPARYRVICAGRQVGKSRLLATLALHTAFARPNVTVLLVSAGEVASRRLLDEIATLANSSPLLKGSVVDETTQLVVLSNGSTIRSVPASQRQIRGWPVDLLIVDEAGFIDPDIWRAAEPAIIARPGSRVVLASSPWGGPDHFFRQLWSRGMKAPDQQVAAWHWPSSVSPMVDRDLLEQIRDRESPAYFSREFLAEWSDPTGAFFTSVELDDAVHDVPLLDPDDADADPAALGGVVGGVDWGMQRDAHALTVIAARAEPDGRGRIRYWVPWVEERYGMTYDAWIARLVELSGRFLFNALSAETNGVGQMPTQVLGRGVWEAVGREVVQPVSTTARLKEDGFGFIRLLLQQGRLALPRHPALLKQLAALEFSQTESGVMRIEVPERAGHDDLAMSLCLAVLPLMAQELVPEVADTLTMEDFLEDVQVHHYRSDGGSFYASPY